MTDNVLPFPEKEPAPPPPPPVDPFGQLGVTITALIENLGDKTVGEAWDELRDKQLRDVWRTLFPEYGNPTP